MSYRVRWLRGAMQTRREQLAYIAADNPRAAAEQEKRIRQHVANLAEHPSIGRGGRVPGTRELIVPRTPFVVVYQVDEASRMVSILRVLHGAQQWPPPT